MNKITKVAKNLPSRKVSPWDLFEKAFNDDFFTRFPIQEYSFPKFEKSDFLPSVDVKEDTKSFKIHADLPGIKKQDIKIKLDKNILSIEGERNEEKEENDSKFHRFERKYGKFSRSFILPETADSETLKAKYEDGVLDILINKKEIPKEEQVKIINID